MQFQVPEGHLGQEVQKTGGQPADLSGSAENTAEIARGQWEGSGDGRGGEEESGHLEEKWSQKPRERVFQGQ